MSSTGIALILDGRCCQHGTDLAAAWHDTRRSIPSALHSSRVLLLADTVNQTLWETATAIAPKAIPLTHLPAFLEAQSAPQVGYVPLNSVPPPAPLPLPALMHGTIGPWVPPFSLPLETAQAATDPIHTWMASTDLVIAALPQLQLRPTWSLNTLAQILEHLSQPFSWQAIASPADQPLPPLPHPSQPTVLAIVPHFQCESWLPRCLTSLVNQSHPPDSIVVIDDASPVPPYAAVHPFPEVTLLASPTRVGPYRLVQQMIEETDYDYYLFQDADDWSSGNRLAHLLATAHHTRADLVGTQEMRFETESQHWLPVHYPLDVNQALAAKPGHPLLHPSSLVRRSLVMQVGGFATGLRFGGDTEFLLRAAIVGRIINLPEYGYFRQKRPHSLTTAPGTGLDSPARQALLKTLKQRAYDNLAALRQGHPPNLQPLSQAPKIQLQYLAGKRLGIGED